MWPFKKKYTYLVKWSYEPGLTVFSELIKAHDPADAWQRIRKQHAISITMVSVERVM